MFRWPNNTLNQYQSSVIILAINHVKIWNKQSRNTAHSLQGFIPRQNGMCGLNPQTFFAGTCCVAGWDCSQKILLVLTLALVLMTDELSIICSGTGPYMLSSGLLGRHRLPGKQTERGEIGRVPSTNKPSPTARPMSIHKVLPDWTPLLYRPDSPEYPWVVTPLRTRGPSGCGYLTLTIAKGIPVQIWPCECWSWPQIRCPHPSPLSHPAGLCPVVLDKMSSSLALWFANR